MVHVCGMEALDGLAPGYYRCSVQPELVDRGVVLAPSALSVPFALCAPTHRCDLHPPLMLRFTAATRAPLRLRCALISTHADVPRAARALRLSAGARAATIELPLGPAVLRLHIARFPRRRLSSWARRHAARTRPPATRACACRGAGTWWEREACTAAKRARIITKRADACGRVRGRGRSGGVARRRPASSAIALCWRGPQCGTGTRSSNGAGCGSEGGRVGRAHSGASGDGDAAAQAREMACNRSADCRLAHIVRLGGSRKEYGSERR